MLALRRQCASEPAKKMALEPKRPASITFLLVGLVLLITAAGLFFCCFPIAPCPRCNRELQSYSPVLQREFIANGEQYCSYCMDKLQITFVNKWMKGR